MKINKTNRILKMLITFVILNVFTASLALDDQDPDSLAQSFQRKYLDSGYSEWKELREANSTTLAQVCSKYVFKISSANRTDALTEKNFRSRLPYMNYTKSTFVELDTLMCNLTHISPSNEVKGRHSFYLAEGDEPNTAFKFSLIEEGVFPTRKVTDVWT